MSQFLASGGQSTGVSASASVLPMNTQDWFPLGLTGWISLQSKGLSTVFSNTTQFKSINSLASISYSPTLTSIVTTGKTKALTRWTFVGKVMSLLFNMLSRLVIAWVHIFFKEWHSSTAENRAVREAFLSISGATSWPTSCSLTNT